MLNESLNLQPLGDSSLGINVTKKSYLEDEERQAKQEIKRFNYLSFEEDGRISGITEIFSSEERLYKLEQGITGVRPEFRGRGIGKWIKAKMMQYIKKEFPDIDFINTGNATTNAPMLSINNRMGFKEYKGGMSVEFDVEELYEKYFS